MPGSLGTYPVRRVWAEEAIVSGMPAINDSLVNAYDLDGIVDRSKIRQLREFLGRYHFPFCFWSGFVQVPVWATMSACTISTYQSSLSNRRIVKRRDRRWRIHAFSGVSEFRSFPFRLHIGWIFRRLGFLKKSCQTWFAVMTSFLYKSGLSRTASDS